MRGSRLIRSALLLSTAAGLLAATALAPRSAVAQMTFEVTSLDDTDADDVGTFRWAVEQANDNDGFDTIVFHDDLMVEADGDFVIRLELNSALQQITDELEIVAPDHDTPTNQQYLVRIIRDASAGDEIIVRQTTVLRNVSLESNAFVFVGGDGTNPTDLIDVVWDVNDFVQDITWPLSDRIEGEGLSQEEPGRIVKTGHGELALLAPQGVFGTYEGGALLVDGVLRTDSRGLEGDITLCTDTPGNGFAASDDCGAALLIFEMPSVAQDEDVDRFDPPTNGTYAGDISDGTAGADRASVVKTGEGRLTLTGTSSYLGDTFVMEGELRLEPSAVPVGDIYVCGPGDATTVSKPGYEGPVADPDDITCGASDPALLTFDIDVNTPLNATLRGSGDVTKRGDARLTVGGDQTNFGGNFNVREGEVVIGVPLGAGGLVEVDVFNGGILETTDVISGDVDVRNGGRLRGDGGTITGDVLIRGGGRIRDALEIDGELDLRGILDVTGDTTVAENARVADGGRIVIDPTLGAPGLLFVNDTLTLRDGAVAPDLGEIDLDDLPAPTVLVAEAAGTIDGELTGGENGDGIQFSNAIFDLALSYGATPCADTMGGAEVCLEINFDPTLEDDAETSNQEAIAGAIDGAYACAQDPDAEGCQIEQEIADDFNDLYGNFAVPSEDIPDILDQLTGDEYAAFADVRASAVARFNRTVSRRFDLEMLGLDTSGVTTASTPSVLPDVASGGVRWLALGGEARNLGDRRSQRMPWRHSRKAVEPMPINRHAGAGGFTAWLDMHGVYGELDGGSQANDIDYLIFGPLFGLDYGVTDNVVVGMTLGYTRNRLETAGDRATGDGDSYQGGVYLGALFEDFYVTGAFRYAYTDFETKRRMRFGDLRRTATADFDATDISGFLEAAYNVPSMPWLAIPENIAVQPFVSLAYSSLSQDDFSENNAGSLNLEIDSQELDALASQVGIRIAMFGRDSDNHYMLPQLRIAYEREWLDPNRPLDASLPAAGDGGSFEVDGAELPRDRAVVGVTSEAGITDRINLFVDYDLRVGVDLLEHSGALGLRALF